MSSTKLLLVYALRLSAVNKSHIEVDEARRAARRNPELFFLKLAEIIMERVERKHVNAALDFLGELQWDFKELDKTVRPKVIPRVGDSAIPDDRWVL